MNRLQSLSQSGEVNDGVVYSQGVAAEARGQTNLSPAEVTAWQALVGRLGLSAVHVREDVAAVAAHDQAILREQRRDELRQLKGKSVSAAADVDKQILPLVEQKELHLSKAAEIQRQIEELAAGQPPSEKIRGSNTRIAWNVL